MTVLQVRNVPEDTHRILKEAAAKEGVSLTAYVVRELNQLARRAQLEQYYGEINASGPLRDLGVDAAALIAEGRAARPWA
jgi:plasmid stability protein